MTTTPPVVGEAEALVRSFAAELTAVRPGECLVCYLARQMAVSGCGKWSHVLRYRDAVAPRATAVIERLQQAGACCCACELFLNGYQLHPRFWTPEREIEQDGFTVLIDAEEPDEVPPCGGVRRGSTQPCKNWVRIRRGYR